MFSSPKFLAWFLLILLSFIWGSSFILMKLGLVAFNPLQMASLRLSIAGLCMAPFVFSQFKDIPKKKYLVLIMSGVLGNGIPAYLFAIAETQIGSAEAGILNSLAPLFILLTGWIAFNAKFSWIQTLGVSIGLGGAFLMVLAGEGGIDLSKNAGYSLLIVLATILYALNTNLIKYYLQEVKPVGITSFSLVFLGIPASLYLLFGTNFGEVLTTHPHGWASFAYVAILAAVGTAFALSLFVRLLQLTSPVFSGMVTYLIPIVAVAWGLYFGETLNWMHFTGLGIIISAVYLVRQSK